MRNDAFFVCLCLLNYGLSNQRSVTYEQSFKSLIAPKSVVFVRPLKSIRISKVQTSIENIKKGYYKKDDKYKGS